MGLKSSPNLAEDKPHYHGHRERLKSRFLQDPTCVPDYEFLELLLYSVHTRRDTKPIAKELLKVFGSLGRLLTVPPDKLKETPSVGEKTLFCITLLKETLRRVLLEETQKKPLLNNFETVVAYCKTTLQHLDYEVFHVLFLDPKGMLIADKELQKGTLSEAAVYPREVLKTALSLGAAAIMLVHNHPSGDTTPSKADHLMTQKLTETLRTVDIKVLDHLIVGKFGFLSFRQQGFLT